MNSIGKLWHKRGYKQSDAIELLHISPSFFRKPLMTNITFKNMKKMANFLGVDVLFLMRDTASADAQMFITAYQNMTPKQRKETLDVFRQWGLLDEVE